MKKNRKQEILDKTDGGLDIFRSLIAGLPVPKRGKTELFSSVFREEGTPSATLFKNEEGVWIYKDFGNTEKGLNAFDFIMKRFNVDFKAALDKAADYGNLPADTYEREPMPEKRVLLPTIEQVATLLGLNDTAFHIWMASILPFPAAHLADWNVGGTRDGKTAFVFQNAQGTYVNSKQVLYKKDGHRDKEAFPYSLKGVVPGEVYGFCLYGEHLLKEYPKGTPVCLVESEKTAVAASFAYPNFAWLATRGQNGANKAEYEALPELFDGRPLLVLCDADPVRKVPKAYTLLRELGANVHLLDLMPERTDKSDMADYLDEGLQPEIPVPTTGQIQDQDGKWRYITNSPSWANAVASDAAVPVQAAKKTKPAKKGQNRAGWYRYIPDEAFEEEGNDPAQDLAEMRIYACKNQYWKLEKTGLLNDDGESVWEPVAISTFTMKVLYFMNPGPMAKRLVELKAKKEGVKAKCEELDTKQLSNVAAFSDFLESVGGHYHWLGNPTDLKRLKMKLFDLELNCCAIDVLGWQYKGFFAFANGIYKDGVFSEVSPQGIVRIGETAFYIPAGNDTYKHDDSKYMNEKRLVHIPREIRFKEWAVLFNEVYGKTGMNSMLFGISALFSDVVFKTCHFFPIMFLYGEKGSGKSSLRYSIQCLFGQPIDPMNISTEANTLKAVGRELAQFRNIVLGLEEFTNSNARSKDQVKGLYDRHAYKRARMDRGVGTESVPPASGAIVTSNEYPIDPPMLDRLIVDEINKNKRSQQAADRMRLLNDEEEKGLTAIACELLDFRELVETRFKAQFHESKREMKECFAGLDLTDRMAQNFAVLDAFYSLLSSEIAFPFTRKEWRAHAYSCAERQTLKVNSDSEIQRFWDIVLSLVAEGKISEGYHLKFNGDILSIRFSEVHSAYMQHHRSLYNTPGIPKTSMIDKLRMSEAYMEHISSSRFDDKVSSCDLFNYEKLNIDLAGALSYKNGNKEGVHTEIERITSDKANQLPTPF